MGKNTIVKNISYNIVNQIVSLIVPLVSAPYIARIFNPELIGAYSYALANSSYFVLLENLGFALYGQIKIASVMDDSKARSTAFKEIYILKLVLMTISLTLYCIVVLTVDDFVAKKLGAIMIINILANGIDVTWFFNGVEAFKTIAIRNIIVRMISLVLVLLAVREESDIYIYAIIMQGAALIAYLLVLPLLKKYIVYSNTENLCIKRHLKPAMIYFIPGLVTTIFSSTDKSMLGIICNNYEVGVYEQANKISQLCMSAISAIGNVLMPRATYLYHRGNGSLEADKLFYKSIKIVLLISLPVTLGISAISEEFIPLFLGKGYEKSALLLVGLSLNVLILSLNNLCGQQCLIARDRQRSYNISVIVPAIVNVMFNWILIPLMQSIGAVIASVFASIVTMAMILTASSDMITVKKLVRLSWKYMVASVFMYGVVKYCMLFRADHILGLAIHILIGIVLYIGFLIVMKEELIYILIKKVWVKHR